MNIFLKWIGIDESSFNLILDQHRDSSIWKRDINSWDWQLLDSILNHKNDQGVDKVKLKIKEKCKFILNEDKEKKYPKNKHIIIGKGIYL